MKRPNMSFVQTIDNKCHRSFHRVFDASGNLRSLRTIISHKKLPMPGNRQLVQTAGTKRMQSSRRFWKLGNPGAGPWAIPFEAMWFNHGSYMVHINHTRYTEKMIKMRLKIDVSKSRVDRTRDSKRYGPILIYLCIRSLGSRRVRLHCSTYFFNEYSQWLNLALRLAHKGANACLTRPWIRSYSGSNCRTQDPIGGILRAPRLPWLTRGHPVFCADRPRTCWRGRTRRSCGCVLVRGHRCWLGGKGDGYWIGCSKVFSSLVIKSV